MTHDDDWRKTLITQELLEDYRGEKISFAELARATREDWRAAARWIIKRWKIPESIVPEDDVYQELLTGCWLAVARYDEVRGKGYTLRQYVWFTAVHRGMRFVHQQRNSHRRSGKAPSRVAVSLDKDAELLREAAVEGDQEHLSSVTSAFGALARVEVETVLGFMNHGADAEAWRLLASQERREAFDVRDHRAAKRLVLAIASEFAERLSAT